MIRGLLLVLLVFALGVGAAYYLRAETGYVLISYGPWVLETSLLSFVAAWVVLWIFVVAVLRLLAAGWRLPRRLRDALARRRRERARESFETGLLKLLEGRWRRAEIELVRRAADHPAGHLNHLLAAHAAQNAGNPERRDHYLEQATLAEDAEVAFAATLTQADLARRRGDTALARRLLLQLRERDPKHPYVVELLAQTYAATGEWTALRELLRSTERLKALPPDRYRELMHAALRALLAAAPRLEEVKSLWAGVPAAMRGEAIVRNAYVRALARLNAEAEAASLITHALKGGWDAELADLYGRLQPADAVGALATVEHWLGQYGEKPELLRVAASACQRNKLWGKARSYLEGAVRLQPTAETYLQLARLCQEMRQPEDAARYYRQGLEAAAAAGN